MKVRVKAPGHFKNQVVDVLRTDHGGRWYQLAVEWQGRIRPSWFEDFEIEVIEENVPSKQESEAR